MANRGRPFDVASVGRASKSDSLITLSPKTIELWLMRSTRAMHEDPAIRQQSTFAQHLGRTGSWVSHIENGSKQLTGAAREQWLRMIGLDPQDLLRLTHSGLWPGRRPASASTARPEGLRLVDDALEAVPLSPDEWLAAAVQAATLEMPRTVQRFAGGLTREVVHADWRSLDVLATALRVLPDQVVAHAVDSAIDESPERAHHLLPLLGEVDGTYSLEILRRGLEDKRNMWMERAAAEGLRRLARRGDIAVRGGNVRTQQFQTLERLPSAVSWAAQAELGAFVIALGPIDASVRRMLATADDGDVRYLGGAIDSSALARLRRRVNGAVTARLDRSTQVVPSDPIADTLGLRVFLAPTRSGRELAAHALSLSPYASEFGEMLTSMLGDASVERENRRSAALALFRFPTTPQVREGLRRGCMDSDPSVRARCVASLTPHADERDRDVLGLLVDDADPVVRRCAVDTAWSAGLDEELAMLASSSDVAVSRAARWYLDART